MEKLSGEWSPIYQAQWYVWILLSLYSVIVELFMAILGLGGLGYGIAALIGLVSLPLDKSMPGWQAYGIFFIEMIFAAWLGWSGLRNSWAEFLAVFTPSLMHEGRLDQLSDEVRHGTRADYHVWVIKSRDKSWEIHKRDLDHAHHSSQLSLGREIRIQYRRGTEQITHLWIKANHKRQHT